MTTVCTWSENHTYMLWGMLYTAAGWVSQGLYTCVSWTKKGVRETNVLQPRDCSSTVQLWMEYGGPFSVSVGSNSSESHQIHISV